MWIEASGPELVVGLLGADGRHVTVRSDRPVLEALMPLLEELLGPGMRTCGEPGGLLVGAGPGSSLGLRVAAMTARTLLRSPALRGADCRQYNLLEVAAVYLLDQDKERCRATALAPYRRDRLYRVTARREAKGLVFEGDLVASGKETDGVAAVFALGHRQAGGYGADVCGADELVEAVPRLLLKHPELTWAASEPAPLQLAPVHYVRWEGRRHGT